MKKDLFRKIITSATAVLAVTAMTATNVFAANTPTINESPATTLDDPAASADVTV